MSCINVSAASILSGMTASVSGGPAILAQARTFAGALETEGRVAMLGILATAALNEVLLAECAAMMPGLSVSVVATCETNLDAHYLEIEPTVLWVYADFERSNDVFSNTTWNIG